MAKTDDDLFIIKLAKQFAHDWGNEDISKDFNDWLPHAKGMLQFFKDNGFVMLADNQDLPDMTFYCPNCDKIVKNTKANIADNKRTFKAVITV
jgi:hypothetical protein